MKLLITGDWHYRSQNPVSRTDDFQKALESKLIEVASLALRHKVEAILQAGDIFDSPSPAYSTLTGLEKLLRAMDLPIWAVPGNHDEFGHSLESLERTAYGHLVETRAIRDLPANPANNDFIEVTGTGFSATTDDDVSDYLAKGKRPVQIHVAHGMLLERAPGFDLKHTLLEDVAKHPDCPDVLVVGHEHLGFGVKRLPRAKGGELVAVNPGALARLSAHPGEIERMPQVCLVEIYPGAVPVCEKCGKPLPSDRGSVWTESTFGEASYGESHNSECIVVCPACGAHTLVRYAEYGPPELWSIGHPVVEATLIPLKSARPGHEVLSRAHIEQAAEREAKMGQFLSLLSREGEAKFLDLQAIVEGVAKSENLPRDVVNEALRRIAAAREALGGKKGAA